MAKQRQPKRYMRDTSIYDRLEDLDLQVDEKYLYLYLLLNRRINFSGLYEIERRTMAFETGISRPRIEAILERLAQLELIVYDNGLLFAPEIPREQSFLDKSASDSILVNTRSSYATVRSELPKAPNKAYQAWHGHYVEQLHQIDEITEHEATLAASASSSEGSETPPTTTASVHPMRSESDDDGRADDGDRAWQAAIEAKKNATRRVKAEPEELDRDEKESIQPPQKTGDPPTISEELRSDLEEPPPEIDDPPPKEAHPPHDSGEPPPKAGCPIPSLP